MDEFSFIDSIKQNTYHQPSLIKGIGDDAAVFRQPTDDIVTAVDTFVEGVHFTRDTMPAYYIGYKALAANLSDLAAMGAKPVFYLVSITIPRKWTEQELTLVYSGMKTLAEAYQMDLIGGDTVSGDTFVLSITVIGYVKRNQARFRDQARPGDVVFVTGTLGDSQAGLHLLLNGGNYTDRAYYINRHQQPTPRVTFALGLTGLSRLALNDVSDGIANEAAEIAEASGVSVVLKEKNIPVHESFNLFPQMFQEKWKYFGGEDYELIGTVAPQDYQHIKKVAAKNKLRVSKMGYIKSNRSNKNTVFLETDHTRFILNKHGYTHLK